MAIDKQLQPARPIDGLIEQELDEGLDIEVFSFIALETAYENALSAFEKEHVTQYFYKNVNDFKICCVQNDINLSHLRWTIDTSEDLEMTRKIYDKFESGKSGYLMGDILKILHESPEITEINKKVERSKMYAYPVHHVHDFCTRLLQLFKKKQYNKIKSTVPSTH